MVNGVRVDELFGTIDAVKKTPVIATFRFRAENSWQDGGHNCTTIKNYYGSQQDHQRQKAFVLDADEPLHLGSSRKSSILERHIHRFSIPSPGLSGIGTAEEIVQPRLFLSRYDGKPTVAFPDPCKTSLAS